MADQYDDDHQLGRAAGQLAVQGARAATLVKVGLVILIGFVIALLFVATFVAAGVLGASEDEGIQCTEPGDPIAPPPPPSGPIRQQQEANAKTIGQVVDDLGLGGQAALLALTAAVGESDLINVNYGDTAGPDSRGLFQQRSSWGTEAERMNPEHATKSFLLGPEHDGKPHGPGASGLVTIENWETKKPSQAIHEVQINADPNHYTKYIPRAREIADAVGIDLEAPSDNPTYSPTDEPSNIPPGSDCPGDGDGDFDIEPVSCPLDDDHAPRRPNPHTCGEAIAFMAKQMEDDSRSWRRLCLALVMQAYGWTGGPATARQGAQMVIDAGMMSTDTKNIPVGSVLWWDGTAVGNDAGHVAVYVGNGDILSNDVPVTDGRVGRVPWTYPKEVWGQKFLGYSPPYFPTAV